MRGIDTKSTTRAGFTIVELLIVIVVIAILAAIAIVAYTGIQVRAGSAVLKSDLAHAARQLGLAYASEELFPGEDGATTDGDSLSKSEGTSFQYTRSNNGAAYCLTATSNRNGVPAFMITHDNTTPREGTCPGHSGPIVGGGDSATPTAVTVFASGFSSPYGLAVDNAGNVYVAEWGNHRIQKITPAGVATVLAGSTTAGNADGVGTAASFRNPKGLAVDGAGNVYVADSNNARIRKITPSGSVTTIASGTYWSAVAVDSAGNVYASGAMGQHYIHKVTPAGQLSVFAGSGIAGNADGQGAAAQFDYPGGITVDSSGNVYVADGSSSGNCAIRRISPDGNVTTVTGTNSCAETGAGIAMSLAADSSNNLLIPDYSNNRIKRMTSSGSMSMIAGDGAQWSSAGAVGPALEVSINMPTGIAIDPSGAIYFTTGYGSDIRKLQ